MVKQWPGSGGSGNCYIVELMSERCGVDRRWGRVCTRCFRWMKSHRGSCSGLILPLIHEGLGWVANRLVGCNMGSAGLNRVPFPVPLLNLGKG